MNLGASVLPSTFLGDFTGRHVFDIYQPIKLCGIFPMHRIIFRCSSTD